MYEFLNIFFFVFHPALIVFNLFGWLWKKTRKLNLFALLLTAFSWMVMGIWYGFGYCFCTDWHWQVRRHLGYHDMPASYIKFLIAKLTGLQLDATLVDWGTAICFILALGASLYVNLVSRKH